jgi:hypothetical protein
VTVRTRTLSSSSAHVATSLSARTNREPMPPSAAARLVGVPVKYVVSYQPDPEVRRRRNDAFAYLAT